MAKKRKRTALPGAAGPRSNWHNWAFEALRDSCGQAFNVEAKRITARDLEEVFRDPVRREMAARTATRVFRRAVEYDAQAARRFVFPLDWLQFEDHRPPFFEKLNRWPSSAFDYFDKSDWIAFRIVESEILPKLAPDPDSGQSWVTSADLPDAWETQRRQYCMEHPYGYVYMDKVDPSSEEKDIHLFLLAVLHDKNLGIRKVIPPKTRKIDPGFYAAAANYCAALSYRSPAKLYGYLAELRASRGETPHCEADSTSGASAGAGTTRQRQDELSGGAWPGKQIGGPPPIDASAMKSDDHAAPGESATKSVEDSQAAEDSGKTERESEPEINWEVGYDSLNPAYTISGKARVEYTRDRLSASQLSKLLGEIPVHFMRKRGRDCRVHTVEFKLWTKARYPDLYLSSDQRDQIADQVQEEREIRQQRERENRRK